MLEAGKMVRADLLLLIPVIRLDSSAACFLTSPVPSLPPWLSPLAQSSSSFAFFCVCVFPSAAFPLDIGICVDVCVSIRVGDVGTAAVLLFSSM